MAVQQIPELMATPGVVLVGPLPKEVQFMTAFSAGVSASAKEADAARALIKFLSTPEAARVIRAKGMEPG
jgi:molybdate transport system substrate-binding protein